MVYVVCPCQSREELERAVKAWSPYQVARAVQQADDVRPTVYLKVSKDQAPCELWVPLQK